MNDEQFEELISTLKSIYCKMEDIETLIQITLEDPKRSDPANTVPLVTPLANIAELLQKLLDRRQ